MKLSEHGKDMLAAFGFAHRCDEAFDLLDDYEFSPEYFEGAVVLSIAEAKKLQKEFLDVVSDVARASGYHKVMLPKPDSFATLEGRIEQAEMSKQST